MQLIFIWISFIEAHFSWKAKNPQKLIKKKGGIIIGECVYKNEIIEYKESMGSFA